MKRIRRVFLLLTLLIFLLGIINLFGGSSDIDPLTMWKIIIGHDTETRLGIIIWEIRIPRLLESALLGGALALSGYLLQSFFANPIAGPYVLGISSGAKLLVAELMVFSYKMMFNLTSVMMVMASFLGSCLATLLVIVIAKKVRNMSILIVCGVMIGYIGSAATELIVSFADDSNIVNLHNWSMGSFASSSWSNINIIVPFVFMGVLFSFLMSKGIGIYLFGENYAISVGMNIRLFRLCLILVTSMLSAIVTAFAGPISFVGIAVPHLIRTVTKTENVKVMIFASFMGGACSCLLCDYLARCMFAPMELSVSTITAIFGAPVVILMLLKRKQNYV